MRARSTPSSPAAVHGKRPALAIARQVGLMAAGGVAVVILLAVGWVVFEGGRDPLGYIEDPLPAVTAETTEAYRGAGCAAGRLCHDVTLSLEDGPPLRFAISLPADALAGPLPAVILFGGLRTGREALKHLPDFGHNAVITYEYPIDKARFKRDWLGAKAAAGREAALRVPGQLAKLLQWTRGQSWADPQRVSLIGVSLGALVLPAAHRKAALHGVQPGPSVLVFGGAGLPRILDSALHRQPSWLRGIASWLGAQLLRPIEPAEHAPHLEGEFLLINGSEDEQIPAASAARLQHLMPEPKQVVTLASGHIDPKDKVLLDRIISISRDWLTARGAING